MKTGRSRSFAFLPLSLYLFFLISGTVFSQQKTLPVFKDGQAQIVEAFADSRNWIVHDLWVETSFDSDMDGKPDRMHVDVTRPVQTETEGLKLPVIYETSPYFGGTASREFFYFWNVKHEIGTTPPPRLPANEIVQKTNRPVISKNLVDTWVPRGYIVVHSSSPGTGLSQGAPTVGGDNESLAPKAVIDWLCGRANGFTTPYGNEKVEAYWSTGKVGMTGTSYNGTLPVAAATTGVDGLEAIIPVAPNTSYYHYYRSNGLVRSPGGYLGEDIVALYDFINSGDPSKRAGNNARIRDKEMMEGMDRITGDYNAFWAGRDYLNDMDPFRTALFMAHGFNDWNVMPEHSYRIYKAAREKGLPVKIYYHQGGHGGSPPLDLMNRWFTRFLHGVDNGVEFEQKAWIVRENDDRKSPTPYPDYPNPDAEMVILYPDRGAPGRGSLSLSAVPSVGMETLVDNYSFSGASLAQADTSSHRLIYCSPELREAVHISGIPKIRIRIAASKSAANLSVWLVSLPWTEGRQTRITDNLITRGWADPQNHRSLWESEPLEPGKFYDLEFELQPDDQIIPAGQKIGLMIFSSDREFTLWPEPGTELFVDLDHTRLFLPVVGGTAAIRKAF